MNFHANIGPFNLNVLIKTPVPQVLHFFKPPSVEIPILKMQHPPLLCLESQDLLVESSKSEKNYG